MEAFVIIAFIDNLFHFIGLGKNFVSAALEIHESISGSTAEDDQLQSLSDEIRRLTDRLKFPTSTSQSQLNVEDADLQKIATRCCSISSQVDTVLKECRAQNPRSKKQSFVASLNVIRKGKEKGHLKSALLELKGVLTNQIVDLAR
jgi:hypothetical protein